MSTCVFIKRGDTIGDLYPIVSSSAPLLSATSCVAFTLPSWHQRLRHPDTFVLQFLHSSKLISNATNKLLTRCACYLVKHDRLLFYASQTRNSCMFELVHSKLWTSHVTSISSLRYYVLLLDDFIHFLEVFPFCSKSDVFVIFSNFHTYVKTQFKS